ncbi:helix-turn-helix domain-containing GNAT family N-acetyltransferase [Dongia soli]|uniref:Helix-turn-helix domain-containing GNAT family N-acetyltransferase n=1 Tax=Dongia soli TaxID=600628 RepID=A0ABU5ED84_9PROT|nr:helix-turn-helix domain-containing GNAT family N-acetyltransferase [Dongia soli]MDY0883398.1 helix-turn-helix domain-containing GNAT family N-acetyltransferase [Dongia soli]
MSELDFDQRIAAIRRFNRFYTKQIGLLQEGLLKSPFSLTESRVLYELANRPQPTATELGRELGLDPGYLSRILRKFEQEGLVERQPSPDDARQSLLLLTSAGRESFAPLDEGSRGEVGDLLARLPVGEQRRLIAAMSTITALLSDRPKDVPVSYLLRPHRPGDMGWIVHRQAVLYAEEYGWDEEFEALIAEITAKFIQNFNPKRERCWIAERDGEVVGSILLVRESDEVAKLRLLYVEPKARGLGIGRRLIRECLDFARQCRYRKVSLWTNDILDAARHLYEEAGFHLVNQERHHSFGHDLVGQNWELVFSA